MHQLTEGNITKQLIQLALPLILANFLQQLYNTIDAWVVGRYLGQEAFAAIGVGGTVMNLFIFVLMGACSGVGIIWAQLYGKNDLPAFRREGFQALAAGVGFMLGGSSAGGWAQGVSYMQIVALFYFLCFICFSVY